MAAAVAEEPLGMGWAARPPTGALRPPVAVGPCDGDDFGGDLGFAGDFGYDEGGGFGGGASGVGGSRGGGADACRGGGGWSYPHLNDARGMDAGRCGGGWVVAELDDGGFGDDYADDFGDRYGERGGSDACGAGWGGDIHSAGGGWDRRSAAPAAAAYDAGRCASASSSYAPRASQPAAGGVSDHLAYAARDWTEPAGQASAVDASTTGWRGHPLERVPTIPNDFAGSREASVLFAGGRVERPPIVRADSAGLGAAVAQPAAFPLYQAAVGIQPPTVPNIPAHQMAPHRVSPLLLAEQWVANYPPLPVSRTPVITYPRGVAVNFQEFAAALSPVVIANEPHRARVVPLIESGELARRTLQDYKASDIDGNGYLSWNNGEIRGFLARLFRQQGLHPPSEHQMYQLYTRFDLDSSCSLDARECLCLTDALLRAIFFTPPPGQPQRQAPAPVVPAAVFVATGAPTAAFAATAPSGSLGPVGFQLPASRPLPAPPPLPPSSLALPAAGAVFAAPFTAGQLPCSSASGFQAAAGVQYSLGVYGAAGGRGAPQPSDGFVSSGCCAGSPLVSRGHPRPPPAGRSPPSTWSPHAVDSPHPYHGQHANGAYVAHEDYGGGAGGGSWGNSAPSQPPKGAGKGPRPRRPPPGPIPKPPAWEQDFEERPHLIEVDIEEIELFPEADHEHLRPGWFESLKYYVSLHPHSEHHDDIPLPRDPPRESVEGEYAVSRTKEPKHPQVQVGGSTALGTRTGDDDDAFGDGRRKLNKHPVVQFKEHLELRVERLDTSLVAYIWGRKASVTSENVTLIGRSLAPLHEFDLQRRPSKWGVFDVAEGSRVAEMRLRYAVSTTPAAVREIRQVECKQTEVKLEWDPPDCDHGAPVVGYQVAILLDPVALGNDKPRWHTLVECTKSAKPVYVISELVGNKGYTVDIRAVNKVGAGDPCQMQVQTAPLAPDPPSKPWIEEARDGCLNIAWKPSPSDGGLPVTAYKVRMRRLRGATTFNQWHGMGPKEHHANWADMGTVGAAMCEEPDDPSVYDAWVGPLDSNSCEYRFQIVAINQVGESKGSELSDPHYV